MKIAVTSTVLFEVPNDDDRTVELIAQHFRVSNDVAIGIPMVTLSGQQYVMLEIERFDVERRRE